MGRTWNWVKGKGWPFVHERFLPFVITVLGLAILGFTLALWVTGDRTADTTVVVNSTEIGPSSTSASATTSTTAKSTTEGGSATTTASSPGAGMATTSVNAKTVTSTAAATRPSDTLFGVLLGVGLVLVMTGAYFYRVTSIKFPGGEIQLAAKAAAAVAKVTTPQEQENPEFIKALTIHVATRLSERAAATGTSPSDAYAEQEAARVRQMVANA